MSDRRWYRSLYWRIGLGFIVLLAVLMAAQAASFVWIAAATGGGVPQRVGQDFAELVATDFESALAADPRLDLAQYAGTRLADFHRQAFVVFPDGRVVGPPGVEVPPGLQRLAELRRRLPPARRGPLRDRGPGRSGPVFTPDPDGVGGGAADAVDPDAPRAGGAARREAGPPPFPRRRRPALDDLSAGAAPVRTGPPFARRPLAIAPIREPGGAVVATVFVSPVVGWRRVVEELGPWLAIGTALLLVGGTAVAALLVFRPAHSQLRGLEAAARRLGEGDLSARAQVSGADEIAAVAHAFNRMADDLAARQAQLVESDRARRQLLADVSHELMTPLTAIRGHAETLALPRFAPAGDQGQRSVRVIQEEVERIERLVGDLLDLARYEAAGMRFVVEAVPVSELFDRVVARHEPAAREKEVAIDVRLPDEEMVVTGDAQRLEQVLQNLTANALRHSRAGGRVTVSAEQREGRTWLRVSDNGAGIEPDHLAHVFDRFYKADPARSEAGSGLGLSIVKAIVERHGGVVRVRSTPGVETIFEVELPSAPGRSAAS